MFGFLASSYRCTLLPIRVFLIRNLKRNLSVNWKNTATDVIRKSFASIQVYANCVSQFQIVGCTSGKLL